MNISVHVALSPWISVALEDKSKCVISGSQKVCILKILIEFKNIQCWLPILNYTYKYTLRKMYLLPNSWILPSIMNNILWHTLIQLNVSFDEEHLSTKNLSFCFLSPTLSSFKIFFLTFYGYSSGLLLSL